LGKDTLRKEKNVTVGNLSEGQARGRDQLPHNPKRDSWKERAFDYEGESLSSQAFLKSSNKEGSAGKRERFLPRFGEGIFTSTSGGRGEKLSGGNPRKNLRREEMIPRRAR